MSIMRHWWVTWPVSCVATDGKTRGGVAGGAATGLAGDTATTLVPIFWMSWNLLPTFLLRRSFTVLIKTSIFALKWKIMMDL